MVCTVFEELMAIYVVREEGVYSSNERNATYKTQSLNKREREHFRIMTAAGLIATIGLYHSVHC